MYLSRRCQPERLRMLGPIAFDVDAARGEAEVEIYWSLADWPRLTSVRQSRSLAAAEGAELPSNGGHDGVVGAPAPAAAQAFIRLADVCQ
eukprot:8672953-Pyramimonas_sp.AAC.1